MNEPTLLPVDRALDVVLETVRPLRLEDVPLESAGGRFLGESVVATFDLPPFTNTAMDGYAVRSADAPGEFRVTGESAAGSPFSGVVGPGEAVAISTGAVLPRGADSVAPIEWVQLVAGGPSVTAGGPSVTAGSPSVTAGSPSVTAGSPSVTARGPSIAIPREVPHGYAIRAAGSDIRRGEELLAAGTRLRAAQIGAAAALGLSSVRCGKLPRVAVLTTGSELLAPGEPLAPGQIYDSNGPLLRAALGSAGAETTLIPAAVDTREAHREAIERALAYDVVVSTGGVSVGEHDLVREIERELGVEELFWRIALKPGKPLSFGRHERTLVFGVPGNPVSVLVCFELFVRPALAALQGARNPRPAFTRVTLAVNVERNPERDEMIRVQQAGDGRVAPVRGQSSHQLALSALSDGLARIPLGSGTLSAGTEVDYLPLGAS